MFAPIGVVLMFVLNGVLGYDYKSFVNSTSPSLLQLVEFEANHKKPIGLITIGSGAPVEIRDRISFNSDFFRHDYFFDAQSHVDGFVLPERVVHAKGFAVWGHFEVINDVSKYTKADVFNGVGKKTTVLARLSVGAAERGVSEVQRDLKGFVVRFYTKDGNLDFLSLNAPIFAFNEPTDFLSFVNAIHRNPKSGLIDLTELADVATLRPAAMTAFFHLFSDFGIPDGWRHMDAFPIHTYELNNKHGERWYVRFAFRTEQGVKILTTLQSFLIQSLDTDYYRRDIYDAIASKKYPSWILEMDVLSLHDVQIVNFNPFDVTTLWPNGTYHTIPIGRLVLNKISENHFRDQEQAAFNPANLVPGIPGPVDTLFRARRLAYRDAQNYRVSRNHLKVGINAPFYAKNYNRDGHPPVWSNEKDAPTYYPNSFNGPLPLVDDKRPVEYLQVLQTNAADLQQPLDFYQNYLDDGAKRRLAETLALAASAQLVEPVKSRLLRFIKLIHRGLYARVIKIMKLLYTKGSWLNSLLKLVSRYKLTS